MSLAKQLKSIFTSGDQFTVLTLINKLIEEVEKYEETVTLYVHKISILTANGRAMLSIPSAQAEPFTEQQFVTSILPKFIDFPCTGAYTDSGTGFVSVVYGIRVGDTDSTIKFRCITAGASGNTWTSTDMAITAFDDIVHDIQEVQ